LGKSYERLHRSDPVVGQAGRKLSGSVAKRRFDNELFAVLPNVGEPRRLGSLWAMFFEQRVLILDFVSQQLAILDPLQILPGKFDFVPLDYRDHKLFVTLTVNGSAHRDMIFDTGSSALALFTTARRWQEWTGRRPDDPRNVALKGKSWSNEVTLAGGPSPSASVTADGIRADESRVLAVPQQVACPFRWDHSGWVHPAPKRPRWPRNLPFR
jgi:hypothetical protein